MGEKQISKDDMLDDVNRVADELDEKYVDISEYKEHGNYPFDTLMSRFVNWQKVLDQAGLQQTRVSREQILEDFKKVADGRDISVNEYLEEGEYSYHYIKKHFGGLKGIKEELGIKDKYDKENLVEDMRQASEKVEGLLTVKKYKDVGNYHPQMIQKKYRWNDLKKEAGLDISERGSSSSFLDRIDKIAKLFEEGKTRKEIAKELEMSYTYFVSQLTRYGIKIRNKLTRTGKNNYLLTMKKEDLEQLGFDHDELYYNKEIKDNSIEFTFSENRIDRNSIPEGNSDE